MIKHNIYYLLVESRDTKYKLCIWNRSNGILKLNGLLKYYINIIASIWKNISQYNYTLRIMDTLRVHDVWHSQIILLLTFETKRKNKRIFICIIESLISIFLFII